MQRPPLLQHWRLCPGLPLPNSGARESADLCCLVFSMVFTAVLSRPCSWWPWRPNRSLWCKGRVLACIRCMPLFQGQLAPAPCILSATILLMSMSSQGYIGDACQTCGTFGIHSVMFPGLDSFCRHVQIMAMSLTRILGLVSKSLCHPASMAS